MSKREILVFLFKRKWSLILTVFTTTLLVTAFVYLLPTSYTATSKVLVEPTKSPTLVTEQRFGADVAQVLYTEIEIVLSRTVMEAVVDKLQLDKRQGTPGPVAAFFEGIKDGLVGFGLLDPPNPREGWIRDLLKDVKVKPVLDTHVFTIAYSDQNPIQAAAVVNAITDAYLSNHSRIYSYENAVEFYRTSTDRAKKEIDRLKQAQNRVEGAAAPSSLPAKRDAAVIETTRLRERIGELRLEMAEVLRRYAPDHPKAVVLRDKLELTARRLASTQGEIQRMELDRDRGDALQPLIDSELESYRTHKKQYDQALLNSVADRQLINAHVVDQAAVPTRPRFPRLIYILAAFVGGCLLGLGIALVREYFDHCVDSPEVAERILGAPVIGSVPRFRRFQS